MSPRCLSIAVFVDFMMILSTPTTYFLIHVEKSAIRRKEAKIMNVLMLLAQFFVIQGSVLLATS